MMLRKHWIFASVLLICIVGISLYLLQTQPPKEPRKIYKPVEIETPTDPEAPPIGDTSQGGHWHGDEWHADPHETHETPAVSAGESYIPEGAAVTPNFPVVDPTADPVEEAYKRLDYIKNNPYAWGGVHSERATELIAVLMPPPRLIDHDHGEVVAEQLAELIVQNDPRAGEVLITHMCSEWGITGTMMLDGLDAIGPPAVPYILLYLEKGVAEGGMINIAVFKSLGRIGELYRADLGGIVDHIIIPKLEGIIADEDYKIYERGTVLYAREALARLGR